MFVKNNYFRLLRVGIISLFSLLFTYSSAYSLDLKPSEIRGKSKVKPVSVLQNRYFLKKYRPEIGIMVGRLLNEAYTDTITTGARGALFFTEWVGVEVQYISTSVEDSDDQKALERIEYRKLDSDLRVNPSADVNEVDSILDVNAIYAPFYGKLNLADKLIVYTDIYFTAGMSKVETDQGDKNAILLGFGHRFYIKKSISFRLDFRNRIYDEERNDKDTQKQSYALDFGMSYFFM